MGSKNSKIGRFPSNGSSSFNAQNIPPSPRDQQDYYSTPQHNYAPSSYSQGSQTPKQKRNLYRRYSLIADDYDTLEQVTEALVNAGLESSNLIIGIDFTKSNEWTGSRSFNQKSLHHIGDNLNPYEEAIWIIRQTLSSFDEDNLIPCFGFGDALTHDQDVFSFYPEKRVCNGFEEVLVRYRELVPSLRLAGPTSFAPVIEMATTIVEGGQYHVLLIIADGQVRRSVDTPQGQLSLQEQKTVDAIVNASNYPLSIILVGVGDGPWDMMKEFDDNLPARKFDNIQFVNFTEIMAKNVAILRKQTEFALASLMEIPSQYKATIHLHMLGRRTGNSPNRLPLAPPMISRTSFNYNSNPNHSNSFQQRNASNSSTSTYDTQVFSVCLTNQKDMAFGCGHQSCCNCGVNLAQCPICRTNITSRTKLY